MRVGEASKTGPTPLSRLRRVGLGMGCRQRWEAVVIPHATEPAVSMPTCIDQSQEMTQEIWPAPSFLPTWVDMSRGDEVEARENPTAEGSCQGKAE